ncbi:MAG: sphingosine-1-phosphate lyase [Deltaproteobacteria bacterium RIFOXYA12_FULL_58_15]|nr:MAG: sphingosine-1-phosphate lyase [Deltaproteobacteria bacterium RIFOXYA12_FULL_58_15]OGR09397.1 MAG: sphingosine-1-phosphate lyase [Deltaproteobacteria bacterium RIFOXYB12_FULL_58_9]
MNIPEEGVDAQVLLEEMQAKKKDDADWRQGKVWSLVYHLSDEHTDLLKKAYASFFAENFLNPMAFVSLKQMETEIVEMCADMLHGDGNVVGTMTSGGTESIMMAMYAYRQRARTHKPWVRRPEVVGPASLHPAFRKAADYFNIKLVEAPLKDDFTVDVRAMKRKIGRNTIALAASAPQYPQGVVDPIEEIAAIARQKKLPFHVDCCIGGFMLPWVEKLGFSIPKFDFRVDGVTSISADVHKYGYSAKGASVVLYKNIDYLKYQFYVSTVWLGGIYVSPAMQGTKSGGSIAAAWAAMKHLGKNGYMAMAKETMEVTRQVIERIGAIPELEIMGKPHMSLVSYRSCDPDVDIFVVADQMEERGWHHDRLQHPNGIHVTVTAHHAGILDQYFSDLIEVVAYVKSHPELVGGNAAMYGMLAKIPQALGKMGQLGVRKVIEKMYHPDFDARDMNKITESSGDPVMALFEKYGNDVLDWMNKLDATKVLIVDSAKEQIKQRSRGLLGRK